MFDRLADISIKMSKKLLENKKQKDRFWFFALLISTENYADDVKAEFDNRISGIYEFPYDLYFRLLSCACHCNMLDELKELLAMPEYKFDINEILPIDSFHALTILQSQRVNPQESLLGIAAYEGYFDIFKYLVEEKNAEVDADTDAHAYTALHQSVRGDADRSHDPSCLCPLHRKVLDKNEHQQSPLGDQHSKIAAYLIASLADITMVATNSKTARELAFDPSIKISKPRAILSFLNSSRAQAPEKNIKEVLEAAFRESEKADLTSAPKEFSYQRVTPW